MSEKMREDFEAWHRAKYQTKHQTGRPTRDMHNGVYDEKYGPDEQQDRWEIWQASRESLVIELPGACECCHGQAEIDMNEACAQAIEAAGLRVKL